MTPTADIRFEALEDADLTTIEGTLVVLTDGKGGLSPAGAEVDGKAGGALARAAADDGFKDKAGKTVGVAYPSGLKAKRLILACLGADSGREAMRKAGGAVGAALPKGPATVVVDGVADPKLAAELVSAVVLKTYAFEEYKTAKTGEEGDDDAPRGARTIRVLSSDAAALSKASKAFAALAEGVFFTRDLVNEPANRLTTDEYAARLEAMETLGLEVEVIGEDELEKMGARALLGVGQGSESESKMVVMRWQGGGSEPPLALIGKGVVFDTGGISIKPASGMEEMTMDMGGSAVVAGVMRALALRKAKANVVGIVGLVENMPDGKAQRPGDIVKSMKGDTIEIINTDAEGRLVLADVLWYAQERFEPAAMIDLATLTGAVIVALGHHNAGFYATDDDLADAFLESCKATGEPAWRLPLGQKYADQLKSRLADLKNTGGRQAGSITAAEFLHRFVKDGTPWMHIDIAGVTLAQSAGDLHPKGATGWGVAALDDLVRRRYEA